MRGFILVAALLVAGCATPFAGLSHPPAEPKKVANWTQEERITPRVVGQIDGDPIVANQIERTYTAGYQETKERLSFLQRIGRWVGSLSLMAFIFIIVALVFFGGAPILWVVNKYFAMKGALKHVVAGVMVMKEDEAKKELLNTLSKEMGDTDKKVIKKIKTEV